jgi:nitrogen regulation protein NR(I)
MITGRNNRLLIVDDEQNLLYSLESALESDNLEVFTAKSGQQGLDAIAIHRPDALLVDIRLPDMTGLDLLASVRRLDPRLPVLVMTAFATTETTIEAMKQGAFDYLTKPVDIHQIREMVGKAMEARRLAVTPAPIGEEPGDMDADRIIGRSALMQQVYKSIGRFAGQDASVLILGESGTGKELVARALFHHSDRGGKPFLAINCAAIPENLLESELFGHEKGAFTGADRQRIGKLEQVRDGTLFLDEIGDMPVSLQPKLLRVLQENTFERLGGGETIRVEARIITATNQNLSELVASGRFRQDLLYRLNGVTITLPSLRDRKEDIPELAVYFIRRFAAKAGKEPPVLAPDTLNALMNHEWPGNIRELENVIRYSVIQASSRVITPECLPTLSTSLVAVSPPGAEAQLDLASLVRHLLQAKYSDIYKRISLEADRIILSEVLKHTQGNQVQASELLGISRNTLRSKLTLLEKKTPEPSIFP